MPYLLRLFSDEYDEICSAVIPSMTDLLTLLRKNVKSRGVPPSQYDRMLRPILNAIVAKMKFDETANWGDEDDATDEAEFQDLRKRLHVLQQTVAAVDEQLYLDVLTDVVASTFARLDTNDKPNWRDLDLAMHEMYLFGELALRNGGMYAKSTPSSTASQRLQEMMAKMVDADLATHPHPAVQLQYMEICVRYVQFFEHHPASISKVLESFVRFVHSDHGKVRLRSWYLFQRFVRHLRAQLGDVAQTVVQAISDLLAIKAELPEDRDEDDISSDDDGQSANAAFNSQLFLFEAVGTVASTSAVPLETKVAIAKSVIDPLADDLRNHLQAGASGDARAVLQIHHVIMAFGSLAYGFSDWMPGVKAGHPPPHEVSSEFMTASEATITALEALKQSFDVRNAARTAFSRTSVSWAPASSPNSPAGSTASSPPPPPTTKWPCSSAPSAKSSTASKPRSSPSSTSSSPPYSTKSSPASPSPQPAQTTKSNSQYLNFILMILNNDLASVLVSPANQATFDPFLSTLTRFGCDPADPQSARLAFSALAKMTAIWGGPDIAGPEAVPAPSLPGFDAFVLAQLAPLPWTLLAVPGFNAQDAQMRAVLQEAGALQWTILRKVGMAYREQLQGELRGLGAGEESVKAYMGSIEGADVLMFRKFFAAFVQQGKR
ncbi:pre-tRNA nuclear export protein [Friedmanniomyces endolithicus]|nr:pre-tRNA nuclear export protein [Friedmanniomyces endolithicus]